MTTLKNGNRERALEIFEILRKKYPKPRTLLNFSNPFELLAATVLAAQCTDERVNKVTPVLFKKWPDPQTLARADTAELETVIKSTGFFHQKAKSLIGLAAALVDRFHGDLPADIDELSSLPGVGRKTANVVGGHCFGLPAVMVDTHFKRVTGRLGLVSSDQPDKIEKEIRAAVPENFQTLFSLVINYHGRYCCKARNPLCAECVVEKLCPYEEKTGKDNKK